jgi:hypothetical protein
MSHRSRYRRAHATTTVLSALVLACVAVIALRASPTWHGVAPGMSESQIVEILGEPLDRFQADTVSNLRYADKEFWLRKDRVFSITMQGDQDSLYLEMCLRFGLPLGSWGESTDWMYGDLLARLHNGRLTIMSK